MNLQQEIYVNKCACGWNFPALSQHQTKCPQCRDRIKRCLACDSKIKDKPDSNFCMKCRSKFRCTACYEELNSPYAKFCRECAKITKKVNGKAYRDIRKEKLKFKETEVKICNYDCFNCIYPDCILPVDPEDLQPALFEGNESE